MHTAPLFARQSFKQRSKQAHIMQSLCTDYCIDKTPKLKLFTLLFHLRPQRSIKINLVQQLSRSKHFHTFSNRYKIPSMEWCFQHGHVFIYALRPAYLFTRTLVSRTKPGKLVKKAIKGLEKLLCLMDQLMGVAAKESSINH